MSNNGGSNFYSLIINKEGKVGQPFATNDVGENHEADEVNFDRQPRFGVHEEEEAEDDDDESAC